VGRVDLSGRAIAITGASSGIGRATAMACARAGMDVALAARRMDRLEAVSDEIRALGRRSIAVSADVGEPGQARAFVEAAGDAFGRLDAVFANAGYGFERATLDCSDDDLRAMFEVNFWGSLETVRAAMPVLEKSDAGHALLCSSCLSKIGLPYYAAYCATKAAQDHFGRALRLELRGRGVAVSTVHPVGTKTEFFEVSAQIGGRDSISENTPEIFMQSPAHVARRVVQALREGADDYVAASGEDDAVLLARIEAAMRRRRKRPRSAAGEPEDAEYAIHVGAITIQPWAFSVLVEGERVDLTVTQFRLLLLLAQQPGRVVRPEEIQQYLAERGSKLRSSSIKSHVYFLRQKLGKAGDQIENVRRVGYRLKEH